MNYGIIKLKENSKAGIVKFPNATNLEVFGRLVLKRIVKEDGKEPNDENIFEYCKEWLDTLIENSDGEATYTLDDVPNQAADNIVYSLEHYCTIDGSKITQLTSDEKHIMFWAIHNRLESVITKFSEGPYRIVEIGTFHDTFGTGDQQRSPAYQIRRSWTEEELVKRNYSPEVIAAGALVDTVRVKEVAEFYVARMNRTFKMEAV